MADSRSSVFQDLYFVVSKTENRSIAKIIKEHRGKLFNSLTKRTDFFIQGYNTEDDDRLGEAGDKNIRVVSPEFLSACLNAGHILDINTYALGDPSFGDGFPMFMYDSKIANLFKKPGFECREREELPQSFNEFLSMEKYTPITSKTTICLLPLFDVNSRKTSRKRTACGKKKVTDKLDGDTVGQNSKEILLAALRTFLELYFCLPVEILPASPLRFEKKTEATFNFGKYIYSIAVHRSRTRRRIDAMETINCLEDCLPKHGFCILGITDEDICEDPADQEPLLGRATGDRAGVLSIWYHGQAAKLSTNDSCASQKEGTQSKEQTGSSDKSISLYAMLNTAAHETMHMFGLDHCAYYACAMNSWSDPRLDPIIHPEKVSPLHLCPIDLRKLQYSCKFDVISRYRKLLDFYAKNNIAEERTWIEDILELINQLT